MAFVLQTYKQNSMIAFSLRYCICTEVLGGAACFWESVNEASKKEGVQMTALSPLDNTPGGTTSMPLLRVAS